MTNLAAILQVESAAERWQAIKKLNDASQLQLDTSGLSLLMQALADEHPFVRWQAGQLLASHATGRQKLIEILEGTAGTTWPNHALMQSAAADALAHANLSDAQGSLLKALHATDPLVRQSAAEALASQKNPEAGPHLSEALKDSDPWVRRAAAYALGHLNSKETIPALIAALQDPAIIVRRSATYALGALRATEAVPQLKTLLSDGDPLIRRNAAWALGRVGQRDAVPDLTQLLDDTALEGSIAVTAAQAIEAITKPRWLQMVLGIKGRFSK